jgi:hypothetical protein
MDERSAEIGNALAKLLAKQANFLCQTQHTNTDILEFELLRKRTLELIDELCQWQRQHTDLPN